MSDFLSASFLAYSAKETIFAVMGTVNKDEFWAELDELGEEGVREKYDLGLYAGRKKDHVEAWFNKQDRHMTACTPWHKMPLGKIVIGVFITTCAGLFVAYVSYRLGWI